MIDHTLSWLRCPDTGEALERIDSDTLQTLDTKRRYPIVEDIPVLLPARDSTLWVADASKRQTNDDPYRLDTLGINNTERAMLAEQLRAHEHAPFAVDPVISALVFATSGHLYADKKHRLPRAPIPEIRLPSSDGEWLVDLGCNWGRWSVASARKGYRVVGVDPSLGALLAAKRLAAKEGLRAQFVAADARFLPFARGVFDAAFSYSVLQHFSPSDAGLAIAEARRVLKPGGRFRCQMASALGVRSVWHLLRRGFRRSANFEVRYYGPNALKRKFSEHFETVEWEVDGYFGLGVQPSDHDVLSGRGQKIVRASEFLRRWSIALPPLRYAADSLYFVGR